MTTNVAAVRVPTPNADTAANTRAEGRGLQNPERGFTLTLSNFEGPFDLLLTLISRRKLDITDVALADVCGHKRPVLLMCFPSRVLRVASGRCAGRACRYRAARALSDFSVASSASSVVNRRSSRCGWE